MDRWDGLGTRWCRSRSATVQCWCGGHGDSREATGIRADAVDPGVTRLGSVGRGQDGSWACHLAGFDGNIILCLGLRCALTTPSNEDNQDDQEEHDDHNDDGNGNLSTLGHCPRESVISAELLAGTFVFLCAHRLRSCEGHG